MRHVERDSGSKFPLPPSVSSTKSAANNNNLSISLHLLPLPLSLPHPTLSFVKVNVMMAPLTADDLLRAFPTFPGVNTTRV